MICEKMLTVPTSPHLRLSFVYASAHIEHILTCSPIYGIEWRERKFRQNRRGN